jgi:polyribonucleotide nucleotidyltransferase
LYTERQEEMMGLFIGKQGANVMRIESVTGCKIDISRDSSQAVVWGSSQERVDAALKVIAEEVNSLSKLVGGASVGQEEQGDVRGSISRVFTIGGSLRVRRLVAGRNGANLNALEAKTSTAISIRSDGQVSVQGSSQVIWFRAQGSGLRV